MATKGPTTMWTFRKTIKTILTLALLIPGIMTGQATQAATGNNDRTILPIPEPEYTPITELDASKAKAPPTLPAPTIPIRIRWLIV